MPATIVNIVFRKYPVNLCMCHARHTDSNINIFEVNDDVFFFPSGELCACLISCILFIRVLLSCRKNTLLRTIKNIAPNRGHCNNNTLFEKPIKIENTKP